MVGETEADNMLSLCKNDRKAATRVMGSCCRAKRKSCAERKLCSEKIWCQGIKTKSSSRTREQHTGREVILLNRCIMHGHQWNKEEMRSGCLAGMTAE